MVSAGNVSLWLLVLVASGSSVQRGGSGPSGTRDVVAPIVSHAAVHSPVCLALSQASVSDLGPDGLRRRRCRGSPSSSSSSCCLSNAVRPAGGEKEEAPQGSRSGDATSSSFFQRVGGGRWTFWTGSDDPGFFMIGR